MKYLVFFLMIISTSFAQLIDSIDINCQPGKSDYKSSIISSRIIHTTYKRGYIGATGDLDVQIMLESSFDGGANWIERDMTLPGVKLTESPVLIQEGEKIHLFYSCKATDNSFNLVEFVSADEGRTFTRKIIPTPADKPDFNGYLAGYRFYGSKLYFLLKKYYIDGPFSLVSYDTLTAEITNRTLDSKYNKVALVDSGLVTTHVTWDTLIISLASLDLTKVQAKYVTRSTYYNIFAKNDSLYLIYNPSDSTLTSRYAIVFFKNFQKKSRLPMSVPIGNLSLGDDFFLNENNSRMYIVTRYGNYWYSDNGGVNWSIPIIFSGTVSRLLYPEYKFITKENCYMIDHITYPSFKKEFYHMKMTGAPTLKNFRIIGDTLKLSINIQAVLSDIDIQIARDSLFPSLAANFTASRGLYSNTNTYTFVTNQLVNNTVYYVRMRSIQGIVSSPWSDTYIYTVQKPTDVEDLSKATSFALSDAYPNPFNPTTKFNYSLPVNSNVKIAMYNIAGEMVKSISSGEKPAGNYEETINAVDLPSGIYLIRLNANSMDGKEKFNSTKKIVLMK